MSEKKSDLEQTQARRNFTECQCQGDAGCKHHIKKPPCPRCRGTGRVADTKRLIARRWMGLPGNLYKSKPCPKCTVNTPEQRPLSRRRRVG